MTFNTFYSLLSYFGHLLFFHFWKGQVKCWWFRQDVLRSFQQQLKLQYLVQLSYKFVLMYDSKNFMFLVKNNSSYITIRNIFYFSRCIDSFENNKNLRNLRYNNCYYNNYWQYFNYAWTSMLWFWFIVIYWYTVASFDVFIYILILIS